METLRMVNHPPRRVALTSDCKTSTPSPGCTNPVPRRCPTSIAAVARRLPIEIRLAGIALGLTFAFGLAGPAMASTVEVEAYAGEPYGVAMVTIRPGSGASPLVARTDGFSLQDPEKRLRFPVIRATYVREGGLLTRLLGVSTEIPRTITVHFLFEGSQPFQLQWNDGSVHTIRVQPRRPVRRDHQRLVNRWWREFQTTGEEAPTVGDKLVHDYQTWQLGDQLSLPARLIPRQSNGTGSDDETLRTLQLALGAEAVRAEVRRATLSEASDRREPAEFPLPASVEWLPPDVPPIEDVPLEDLAGRVPADCFYIRFGSFSNYLWLNQLLTDFGGDLASMVAPQPLRQEASQRVQQQLGLKQSALAEVMGPAVIADVALVGFDLYLTEGAALGILFQARNSPILRRDLTQQRRMAMAGLRDQGATEETVTIGQREVSLVSTPDHALRSFYVVDGDYHLVTTSRRLVERFLEVRDGSGVLAELPEFQRARELLPLDREDTVFVYFSTPFLQNLVSPHYQVERLRRLRAATDMELLALAKMAAEGRGFDQDDREFLIENRFFPAGAAKRPEEGEVTYRQGELIDTLRGARGTFLPIPDVELQQVTRSELADYQRRATYYQENWRQFDPLMIAVQRTALNRDGLERIAIEAHLTPLNDSKYGKYLSILGPPAIYQVAPVPGDLAHVQAYIQGGDWSRNIAPHLLFLGIQDSPALSRPTGLLQTLSTLRATPGYLGAWPKLGFLDWLPVWIGGGDPDPHGYSRLPLGLWRRQWENVSLLSFQRPVLDHASAELDFVEATDPAQLRLYVGDISQSEMRGFINRLSVEQTLETSLRTAGFLNRLSTQMGIDRPEALAAAELLLDGQLVCPLSGEPYTLMATEREGEVWASTAWVESNPLETEEAPVMAWFRGLNMDLTRDPEGVLVRGEIDMQRRKEESPASLPMFDFFRSQRPTAAPSDAEKRDRASDSESPADKEAEPASSDRPRRQEF